MSARLLSRREFWLRSWGWPRQLPAPDRPQHGRKSQTVTGGESTLLINFTTVLHLQDK